jgi:hypothetical protein
VSVSASHTASAFLPAGSGTGRKNRLVRSTRVPSAVLPALPMISRVAGTHYCVPAPSEPCKQLFTAHGSSKPQRLAGRHKC